MRGRYASDANYGAWDWVAMHLVIIAAWLAGAHRITYDRLNKGYFIYHRYDESRSMNRKGE